MSGRPVARRSRAPLPTRRTRSVRRASAGLSTTRAGAALVMLAAALAIYGVAVSSAFSYTRITVDGDVLTDRAAVESAIGSARRQNLFGLRTGPLEAMLATLPTVGEATVQVQLPDTLAVTLHERVPVLIWQVGALRYATGADGALFALLPDAPPASVARLPIVDDQRASSAGLSVGQALDPVDVDAATRLASLVPTDVGSAATTLAVLVTDENGFVVRARPGGWSAVFGFYTPSLRTTDLIPGQVRLLRSLLAGREPSVDRVVLASETDGTYVPRATPSPSAKPKKAP